MICIIKKSRKRKINSESKGVSVRRNLATMPTVTDLGPLSPAPKQEKELEVKDAPRAPESFQSESFQLDFIDNPQFHQRGAEKRFPAELTLAAEETSAPSASSSLRVAAPLALACETRLLKPEEEQRLFSRMNFCKFRAAKLASRRGSQEKVKAYCEEATIIRNRIIRSNTRLVASIAKSFVDAHNTFDDLFSDGVIALVQATEKFDFQRGFRFSTYATRAIRRNLYRIVTNRRRDRTRFSTGALDNHLEPEETDRGSTISEARWDDLQSRLKTLLASLDPRERQIVRARFGLESNRDVQTLQSLAKKMGVCKERVRQLEKRALDKLRQMAGVVKLEEAEV